MFSEETCSRCGSKRVAGTCPACGNAGRERPRQKPKSAPRGLYAGLGSVLAILVSLLPIVQFRLLQHSAYVRQAKWPKHDGPVAQLSDLHGHGIIYLVQLTPHSAPYSVDDLAQWLHTRYGLDARTLPPEPLPKSAWHPWHRQYVAELLYAEIKRENPLLAANPDAYLIGVTDADMRPVSEDWSSTFTQRDGERAAVLSSATLEDRLWWWQKPEQRKAAEKNLQARMRRVLLKDVAMLYWHLPVNNDPSSLLHQPQNPDLPTEDIYASDLDPASSDWGQFEGEPCIFFRYSATTGLEVLPGRLIRTCSEVRTPQKDDSTELFQVDLRFGMMVDRRTDLLVPGNMPIAFERTLRAGWRGDNPFGASGSDSYDRYLASRDNIYITAMAADGVGIQLVRDPIWLSYLPLVKYVDTEFSGSYYAMRWLTTPYPHYDLQRYDGQVESYLPCYTSAQFCYLNGVKEADGRALTFDRDAGRHLLKVTSSDGSWLKLQYGPRFHIEQASDNHGQSVRYGYDQRNQLSSVTYGSGETLSFSWDDANHLTAFSASPDGKSAPKVLLRSEYQNGFLSRQVLADGSTYLYTYGTVDDRRTRSVVVETSDGKTYTMRRFGSLSGVWETDAHSKSRSQDTTATTP
jgi:YD repeat-containing protein